MNKVEHLIAAWHSAETTGVRNKAVHKMFDELRRLSAVNAELLLALKSEKRLRLLETAPEIHWDSIRDISKAVNAATDAAIQKAEEA